jgi:hypothetical protein
MVDVLNAFEFETNEALITTSEGTLRAYASGSIFSLVFGLACNSLRFVFGLVCCVLGFL